MEFASKKDKGVYYAYIVIPLVFWLTQVVVGDGGIKPFLVLISILGIIEIFMVLNIVSLKYIITESELIIKTCMFKKCLKLSRITKIAHITGGYSFTATSMQQLRLTYLSDMKIRISPENMEKFEEYLRKSIRADREKIENGESS